MLLTTPAPACTTRRHGAHTQLQLCHFARTRVAGWWPALAPGASCSAFLALPRRQPRLRSRHVTAAAAAAAPGGDDRPQERALAPVKPESPVGDFLSHVLSMEPHLFDEAVDTQLDRLASEVQAEQAAAAAAPSDRAEITLYARIADVKKRARTQAVQDLMYYSVLRKFMAVGVDLLPPLDGKHVVGGADLLALTKGVHSQEALEWVKEHLENVLGMTQGPGPFSNAMVRMSKLQASQIYIASLMFGYFLRRIDSRFQLERHLGTLPRSMEESVQTLEELFNNAAAASDDVGAQQQQPSPASDATGMVTSMGGNRNLKLKRYLESFDAETLSATARIVSTEGAALVERQTTALFGSVEHLTQQMAQAIGTEVKSREDFMQRMNTAMQTGQIDTVTLPYSTQRRVVLEAVAFGAFLRDVETRLGTGDHALLLTAAGPDAM